MTLNTQEIKSLVSRQLTLKSNIEKQTALISEVIDEFFDKDSYFIPMISELRKTIELEEFSKSIELLEEIEHLFDLEKVSLLPADAPIEKIVEIILEDIKTRPEVFT